MKSLFFFVEFAEFEDEPEDCLWLKINTGPWNTICEKWKSTSEHRHTKSTGQTIEDIFKEWKILKHPDANQLVKQCISYVYVVYK